MVDDGCCWGNVVFFLGKEVKKGVANGGGVHGERGYKNWQPPKKGVANGKRKKINQEFNLSACTSIGISGNI